jgi:hypothetical protein
VSLEQNIQQRLQQLRATAGGIPLWVKIDLDPERSATRYELYRLMDEYLEEHPAEYEYEVHESGPEFWLSVTANSLSIIASLAALISLTVPLWRKPRKHPVEILIRTCEKNGTLSRETSLRFETNQDISAEAVQRALKGAIEPQLPINSIIKTRAKEIQKAKLNETVRNHFPAHSTKPKAGKPKRKSRES